MKINNTRNCKRILFNYNNEFECKCGSVDNPIILSGFIRVCRNCKRKYSATNGTIFHNIRFGLLKAFRILIIEYNNNFTSKSTEISRDFNITQKTSWAFLNKIRHNKDEVKKIVEFEKKPRSKSSNSKINEKKLHQHFMNIEKLRNSIN